MELLGPRWKYLLCLEHARCSLLELLCDILEPRFTLNNSWFGPWLVVCIKQTSLSLLSPSNMSARLQMGHTRPSLCRLGQEALLLVLWCIKLERRCLHDRYFRWVIPLQDFQRWPVAIHRHFMPTLHLVVTVAHDADVWSKLLYTFYPICLRE